MNKKYITEKEKQHYPVDLTRVTEQQYVCEDCGIVLFLYPPHLSVQHFPMERGPHYICPKCHTIIDLSAYKPPSLESVQPLDVSPPTFVICNENKGGDIPKVDPYDPEPNEEQWLKNIGATLISKRIQVG